MNMKRHIQIGVATLALTTQAHAGMFGASNWYECVLNRMPGVQNNYAASAILKSCYTEFGQPEPYAEHPPHGWFARYPSGDACTRAKAAGTGSELGARVLTAACHHLYDR